MHGSVPVSFSTLSTGRQRPTEPFDVSVPVWPDALKRRTSRDGVGVTGDFLISTRGIPRSSDMPCQAGPIGEDHIPMATIQH